MNSKYSRLPEQIYYRIILLIIPSFGVLMVILKFNIKGSTKDIYPLSLNYWRYKVSFKMHFLSAIKHVLEHRRLILPRRAFEKTAWEDD